MRTFLPTLAIVISSLLVACSSAPAAAPAVKAPEKAAAPTSAPAAAAPTTAPAPTAAAPSGPLKKMTVQLTFVANVQYYGVSYAAKTGIFEKNGLSVDYKPGGAGVDSLRMAAAGAADVGFADATSLLVAIANSGAELTVFGADFQKSPNSVMCREDRGVKTFQDIKGKNIGLKPNAVNTFPTLLARNNMTMDDIKSTPIGLTDITPIIAGTIDCQFSAFFFNEPITVRKNGVTPVNFLITDYGMPSQAQVLVTQPEKLKADPAAYVAFVKSVQEAWETFIKDPEAAARWVVDNRLVDGLDVEQQIEQAKAEVPLIKPEGMTKPLLSLEPEVWKATLQAAKDAGTIGPEVNLDLSTILDPTIVEQTAKKP